jgi:hypothetical protein
MAFMQFLLAFVKFYQYYLIVALVVFLLIARAFRGLFNAYLEVKISAGRPWEKILLNVRGISGKHYFVAGKIKEDILSFKFKKRDKITINIPLPEIREGDKPFIYTFGTAECINIDEKTCSILKPGFEPTERVDYNKIDSLLARALYRPSKDDTLLKVVIVLGAITMLAVLYSLYIGYKDHKLLMVVYNIVSQIPVTELVVGG